jgi:hypothetical protein
MWFSRLNSAVEQYINLIFLFDIRLVLSLLMYDIVTCRGLRVTYKAGFGLDDWLYWLLFTQLGTTGNYSTVAILHTFQFTVAHALGFSVFTSQILVTVIKPPHCNFYSHIKSSLHFLCHFSAGVKFNSSAPNPISWQAGAPQLDYTLLSWTLLYNHFTLTTLKTQPFSFLEGRRVYSAVA